MPRSDRAPSDRSRVPKTRRLETHSAHVRSVYEILGAYFVDIAYNHLYLTAKHNAQGRSVTDEYRACLAAYATGVVNDPDVYIRTVKGVVDKFRTSTRFGSIGMGEFIDHMIKASVPAEIYEQLQESDRRGFLAAVLKRGATGIAEIAGRPQMLASIIDDHGNLNNVFAMQNEMISELLGIRDEIFHKFLERFTGKKKRSADADLVRNLRAELRELATERDKYREALKRARGQLAESTRVAAAESDRADKSVRLIKILMGRLTQRPAGVAPAAAPVPVPVGAAPASAAVPVGVAAAPVALAPIVVERSDASSDDASDDASDASDGDDATSDGGASDGGDGGASDGGEFFVEDPFAEEASEESAFASDSSGGLLDVVDTV